MYLDFGGEMPLIWLFFATFPLCGGVAHQKNTYCCQYSRLVSGQTGLMLDGLPADLDSFGAADTGHKREDGPIGASDLRKTLRSTNGIRSAPPYVLQLCCFRASALRQRLVPIPESILLVYDCLTLARCD